MKRVRSWRQVVSAALAIGTAVFVMAVGLPHHHDDGSPVSHRTHTCRACKLQDGASATPPAGQALLPALASLLLLFWTVLETPRAVQAVRLAHPRAPPVLS